MTTKRPAGGVGTASAEEPPARPAVTASGGVGERDARLDRVELLTRELAARLERVLAIVERQAGIPAEADQAPSRPALQVLQGGAS